MIGRLATHLLIMALVACSIALSPPVDRIGSAAHYAPGVMERVAAVRGLPRVRCMVSSPYEQLGTWLRIEHLATGRAEFCRVTDVSAPRDRARHIRRNLVVELGWPAAQRLCGVKRGGAQAPWECKVRVRRIR